MMEVDKFIKMAYKMEGCPTVYVNGAFGAVASEKNKERYKNAKNINRWGKIDACPSNGFFTDCCGVPKGILWGWNGDTSKVYGGAVYKSNGVPDINEKGLIDSCSNVSTNFNIIEKGELVYMKGHCGIYVGDGLVIESTPSWDCGVQLTGLGNIGVSHDGKTRKWEKHGYLDKWISYKAEPIPDPAPVSKYTLEDFRRDVRGYFVVDTNQKAFEKTIRISTKENNHNNLVTFLEKYMRSEGYYHGIIEAEEGKTLKERIPDFGSGMKQAIIDYQKKVVKLKNGDGILDPQGATWKKLLLG